MDDTDNKSTRRPSLKKTDGGDLEMTMLLAKVFGMDSIRKDFWECNMVDRFWNGSHVSWSGCLLAQKAFPSPTQGLVDQNFKFWF